MKAIFTLALFFALISTIAATALGPNADRLRRGLPPLAPRHLYTPSATTQARRSSASGTSQCNTGSIQCCNSVENTGSSQSSLLTVLLGLLNLTDLGVNVPIGITCSPISILGAGGDTCSSTPVCCENNTFNGVIAVGCVPINIHL